MTIDATRTTEIKQRARRYAAMQDAGVQLPAGPASANILAIWDWVESCDAVMEDRAREASSSRPPASDAMNDYTTEHMR